MTGATARAPRNARLSAIHSLFCYAALRHPEHAALIQRVLAIPPARFEKATVSFLTRAEAAALCKMSARLHSRLYTTTVVYSHQAATRELLRHIWTLRTNLHSDLFTSHSDRATVLQCLRSFTRSAT
jgi:hypothetical protein